MKKIIILVVSFLMASTSCVSIPDKAPVFPESIKNFYVIDMAAEPVAMDKAFTAFVENANDLPSVYPMSVEFACLKFDIISKSPFKLKYIGQTDARDCRSVGGFQPDDHTLFYNFVDDSQAWMKFKEGQCSQ